LVDVIGGFKYLQSPVLVYSHQRESGSERRFWKYAGWVEVLEYVLIELYSGGLSGNTFTGACFLY
jgi:hypothetical protein